MASVAAANGPRSVSTVVPQSKPCVVYVVQQMGGGGVCKVGVSENFESLLRSLQTGSAYPLRVHRKFDCPDVGTARRCERAALRAVRDADADAELRGEWFQPWMLQGVCDAVAKELR